MDTERNLLFGILARRAGYIGCRALIEALGAWSADRRRWLADVLADRERIDREHRAEVESTLEQLARENQGDVAAALSNVLENLGQCLSANEVADIRRAVLAVRSTGTQSTLIHPGMLAGASGDDSAGHAETRTTLNFQGPTISGPLHAGAGSTSPLLGGEHPAAAYPIKLPLPSGPRYTRTSLHASGGMGAVWLAHDAAIGRDVALKELRSDGHAGALAPLRFLREARITGQLEHPGIVPVYEIGADPTSGSPFYTMRFVRGRTLTEATRAFHKNRRAGRDEPLDFVNLLSALVSVCHTIAYAHSHGIVHRDLKGENIILGDFGEVIVLDWGLAKRLDPSDDEPSLGSTRTHDLLPDAGQTMMGQVMGTPAYMAPEQANGRSDLVGPCTDIFGIGAILYEILAGRPPFSGTTTIQVLHQAQQGEIVPPREGWPDAHPDLEAICMKALSKEPANRHATATELAREVQGWQDKQRRRAEDQLRHAGERLMKQQSALVSLTRSELFASRDLQQIFRRMCESSARTLGVERVGIWRYTADRRAIRCQLLYELGPDRATSGMELRAEDFPKYFEALETSEVIPAHDACRDPSTREFSESYLVPLGIGAIMDAPLHVDGEMRGVVCHEHVGDPRQWMPDEQLFAIAIANLVSQAISQWDRP